MVAYGKIRERSMDFFVKNFFGGLWDPYRVKRFFEVIVGGEQCVKLLSDCPNI